MTTASTNTPGNQRILSFLKSHPVGTLATVTPDGDPHGAVLYYSIDDEFVIRFTTKTRTRKFDNLAFRNRAMLIVFDADLQTTVQIAGNTEVITDEAESQVAFREMLGASLQTSRAGLPPVSKLYAGVYTALRLKPVQITMLVYASSDPSGYDMYESVEFDP